MNQIYNPDNLSKSQLWMLALGAILVESNDEGHDTLSGGYNNIKTTQSSLNRDFGIKNRTDLISCLNSLIKGSSIATEFLEQSNFLSVLSEDAQKTYSSWTEYGLAYAVGRQYWQGLLTKDYADEQLKLIKNLLVNENSPWVMLDWNTPLD